MTTDEKRRARNTANQKWRRKNRARVRRQQRGYTKKRSAKRRAEVRAYANKWNHDNVRRVIGRVCVSCSAKDSESLWSRSPSHCAACLRRGQRNGFCRECGAARYRGPNVKSCACQRAKAKVPHFSLQLWDALRWQDESKITLRALALKMEVNLRTIERRQGEILKTFKRFDPQATASFEDDVGGTKFFSFSPGKVSAGLERIAFGQESP